MDNEKAFHALRKSLRILHYKNLKVYEGLAFYNKDNIPGVRYGEFWIYSPEGIFRRLQL